MSRRNKSKKDGKKEETSKGYDSKSKEEGMESKPPKVEDKKTNDPEWYARFPQLLIDSASLPFAYGLGQNVNLAPHYDYYTQGDSLAKVTNENFNDFHNNPGIATFYTYPSFGVNMSPEDPLNMATVGLYTHVRYVNSGRKNYDAPDLMLYCLALSDLYSFTFWCRRLYNMAFVFSQANKYIGDAMLKSEGVLPGDMRDNLAKFRYWLNTFIHRVTQYALPSDLLLIAQRVYMYSGLYIDSETTIKDQMYKWSPIGFYRFATNAPAGMANAGALQFVYLDSAYENMNVQQGSASPVTMPTMSVQDIIDYGEAMLGAMFGDEDFVIMSGDLVKAFEGRLIQMNDQPEEGFIMPTYDENVLSQMKNATITGVPNHYISHGAGIATESHKYDVMRLNTTDPKTSEQLQNGVVAPGWIIQTENVSGQPTLVTADIFSRNMITEAVSTPGAANWNILTLTRDQILTITDHSPAKVVEATRLMVNIDPEFGTFLKYDYVVGTPESFGDVGIALTSGTFSVAFAGITKMIDNSSMSNQSRQWLIYSNVVCERIHSSEYGLIGFDKQVLELVQQFDHFPTLYLTRWEENSVRHSRYRVLTHITDYSIVDNAMLSRLHTTSLLSLLYVPGVAKFTGTTL